MKLKGHKPGCKCVGCSSETRRRGMAALKRAPRRNKNPLDRSEIAEISMAARQNARMVRSKKISARDRWFQRGSFATNLAVLDIHGGKDGRKVSKKIFRSESSRGLPNPRAAGLYFVTYWDHERRSVFSDSQYFKGSSPSAIARDYFAIRGDRVLKIWKGGKLVYQNKSAIKKYLKNPLTRAESSREIRYAQAMARMGGARRRAGRAKESTWYYGRAQGAMSAVSEHARGAKRRRKAALLAGRFGAAALANPSRLIGTRVRLYGNPGASGSALYSGPTPSSVIFITKRPPRLGARISRIDYDHRQKALDSYGRPGRFRHDCKVPLTVKRITRRGRGYVVVLASPVTAWRNQ